MRRVCQTITEVAEAFKDFNFKLFSLDTETDNSVRYDKLNITVITLYDGTNSIFIECNPGTLEYVRTYFNSFVNRPSNTVMCHNIVFDMKVLHKYNISLRNCEWFDTMVAYHLIDENDFNYGLKDLAIKFLEADVTKYSELSDKSVTNDKFIEYALNDAIYTYKLGLLFAPKLKSEGLTELFRNIEMPFLRPLLDIELNGILIDVTKLQQISADMLQQLQELETQIYEKLGIKYEVQCNLYGGITLVSDTNLASSEDLADILFNKLGLKAVEVSEKTGKPSVGKFTLENLKGQHEVVDMIIKHKVLSKMLSSFSYDAIKDFIDSDGRIRSNYRDTGTVTGRLSCNNMNLQQLPKEKKGIGINIREVFIAGEGNKFIAADYSGQELRILAEVTRDEKLIEAFNSGRDFHQETANQFCVTRSQAKAINFGIAYGKGAYGFSQDFKITEEEAQKILDNYFSTFPKVKQSIEETKKELDKCDYVSNLYGRKRRMSKVTMNSWTGHLKRDYRQAFNFKIQGSAADMIRIAAIKCYELSKEFPLWDLRMVATIHDEICFVVKDNYANVACTCIKGCFENAVNFCIPVLADVKQGDNYAQAK